MKLAKSYTIYIHVMSKHLLPAMAVGGQSLAATGSATRTGGEGPSSIGHDHAEAAGVVAVGAPQVLGSG